MTRLICCRIYDRPLPQGTRVLVDRLWPRGMSKVRAALDFWAKTIAPSSELRKWFSHDPEKFDRFAQQYQQELIANPDWPKFKAYVQNALQQQDVLLLYGAKDRDHNQAIVLKALLETQLKL